MFGKHLLRLRLGQTAGVRRGPRAWGLRVTLAPAARPWSSHSPLRPWFPPRRWDDGLGTLGARGQHGDDMESGAARPRARGTPSWALSQAWAAPSDRSAPRRQAGQHGGEEGRPQHGLGLHHPDGLPQAHPGASRRGWAGGGAQDLCPAAPHPQGSCPPTRRCPCFPRAARPRCSSSSSRTGGTPTRRTARALATCPATSPTWSACPSTPPPCTRPRPWRRSTAWMTTAEARNRCGAAGVRDCAATCRLGVGGHGFGGRASFAVGNFCSQRAQAPAVSRARPVCRLSCRRQGSCSDCVHDRSPAPRSWEQRRGEGAGWFGESSQG